MRGRFTWGWGVVVPAILAVALSATLAGAQGNNAFGIQNRADAARQAIILGVTQGISALPPTSGQSFVFEYDPTLDTYKKTGLLGPTALRTPLTIGKGNMSLRVAGSYFELSKNLSPIFYRITGFPGETQLFTKFGLNINAKVGLVNLSYTYGLTETLEFNLNVPLTVVDANARSSFVTPASAADDPIADAPVASTRTEERMDELLASGALILRSGTVNQLGAKFNEGTSAGLGRVSLGAKTHLFSQEYLDLAFSTEIFLPSPSENDFSGPQSASFLPRLIGAANLTPAAKLHTDLGYDFDTSIDELRRFVWNVGGSYALQGATFDAGVGGSLYNQGIEWTPGTFTQPPGSVIKVPLQLTAIGGNTLGTTYVDFLFGAKVQIASNAVLSGAVSVPLNDEGIRPAAAGTLAIEAYF